jgi:ferredoxin
MERRLAIIGLSSAVGCWPETGPSILEAGWRHGIDMRYSCRGGVCSTCRCKVQDGKVDMDVNHALEDDEIARGVSLTELSDHRQARHRLRSIRMTQSEPTD